jgi:hypothetical protein
MLLRLRKRLARALYADVFDSWDKLQRALSAHRMRTSDAGGISTFGDSASRAIEGMPPSPLAKTVKDRDLSFVSLCNLGDGYSYQKVALIILAFDISREITERLARGYATLQTATAAAAVNSEQVIEYRKLVGDPSKLQRYLAGEFPTTWASLSDGRPLVDITEEIVRRIRAGQPVI